ncbi:MAG: Uma2 family endonuclease [Dethiobacter sp.]|nr:Uma2 family endonuclease [Dethiobacter sp.]
MGIPVNKADKKYTYKDYLTWSDDERWELIKGIPFNMGPAPSRKHQKILRELVKLYANYLTGKTCEVYHAPFDVRLPQANEQDESIGTVVQPDLVVICDRSKLDDRGCKGAPDLVVEILSPHTAKKDMEDKFLLYEQVQVKEYWIIDPHNNTVLVYKLEDNNKYGRHKIYSMEDELKPGIFEDMVINLMEVFAE